MVTLKKQATGWQLTGLLLLILALAWSANGESRYAVSSSLSAHVNNAWARELDRQSVQSFSFKADPINQRVVVCDALARCPIDIPMLSQQDAVELSGLKVMKIGGRWLVMSKKQQKAVNPRIYTLLDRGIGRLVRREVAALISH